MYASVCCLAASLMMRFKSNMAHMTLRWLAAVVQAGRLHHAVDCETFTRLFCPETSSADTITSPDVNCGIISAPFAM